MGLAGQIINLFVVAGMSYSHSSDKYSQAMADALVKQTAGAEQQHYGWAA